LYMGCWGNAKGTMVEGAGTNNGGVSKWGHVGSRELDVRVKTKTWRTDTFWAAGRRKQIPLRDAQGRNDETVTYFWGRWTGEGARLYMSIDSFLL
jgi:hypothetical protein